MMKECCEKAYAKVNLGLDVIGRYPDGYHEVKMIMQSLDLCDELILWREGTELVLTVDSSLLPADESNLVYRAMKLMREHYGITEGIKAHLKKRIPIAAGMAGGSADAAAALRGINTLFELNAPLSELANLGCKLGADIPYCVTGGTALAEGIGERLTVLPKMPDCFFLIAKPDCDVMTGQVYRDLDAVGVLSHPDIDGIKKAIEEGSLQGIVDRLENVLEHVTIPMHPLIDEIKKQMLVCGAEGSLMSGSGPTVFGIFTEKEKVYEACKKVKESGLARDVFVAKPM